MPIVKVIPIVTYEMYTLGPPMNLHPGRVTFNDPEVEKSPEGEEANCSTECSITDIETWLEFQAWQLGTPAWCEELGAIPGIKDLCKFAQKIRASFYILEIVPEPIVKVIPIVTYEMYTLGPPMNLHPGRVTFNDPKVEKSPEGEEANCSTECSITDIETWLEFQAWQLGTPAWCEELGAIPGIKDLCKFAQKIRASFYILEIVPEPIVKVIPIVTYEMYTLGPPMNLHPGRVTFNDPEVEKSPEGEEANCSTEPSIAEVEMWLEWQAWQLGTPAWWVELGAIPGIKDLQKFTQKIRASFYIPEVWMRASLEQVYTAPPAPQSLNRNTFLPEKLAYQDVQQQPALLTIAYALKSPILGGEACHLPRNPDFCPLAESVRELGQMVQEFVTFSHWDVTQGLEVGSPEASHPQLKMTIFSQVLPTPVNGQETAEAPSCPISPLLRRRLYGAPPHSLRLSGATGICWLLSPQWAN